MNKKPDRTDPNIEEKVERLGSWLKLVGVLFRLMIVLGLILMLLVMGAILFTSLFSFWIMVLPVLVIALGLLLAWVEYKLHSRYYALKSRDLDQADVQEENHG